MCTLHYCSRQLLFLKMERRLLPLPLRKGYPDEKVKMTVGWGKEGVREREVIQRWEKFHFLPCTEKMVSARKTWHGDGRFTLPTLITICSFPDNNTGKMHKPLLKWKSFLLSSLFLFGVGRWGPASSSTRGDTPNRSISYYWMESSPHRLHSRCGEKGPAVKFPHFCVA